VNLFAWLRVLSLESQNSHLCCGAPIVILCGCVKTVASQPQQRSTDPCVWLNCLRKHSCLLCGFAPCCGPRGLSHQTPLSVTHRYVPFRPALEVVFQDTTCPAAFLHSRGTVSNQLAPPGYPLQIQSTLVVLQASRPASDHYFTFDELFTKTCRLRCTYHNCHSQPQPVTTIRNSTISYHHCHCIVCLSASLH